MGDGVFFAAALDCFVRCKLGQGSLKGCCRDICCAGKFFSVIVVGGDRGVVQRGVLTVRSFAAAPVLIRENSSVRIIYVQVFVHGMFSRVLFWCSFLE